MPNSIRQALLASLVAILAATLFVAGNASATTTRIGGTLRLHGQINRTDLCQVAEALVGDHPITRVIVDSRGGDAWAGARIGRLLGWSGAEAVVEEKAVALSAAAVVVIGAPHRVIRGQIGFHAPFEANGRTDTVAQASLAEINREVRAVLVLGGMPPFLVETAMKTGRNNMFVVAGSTIESYDHRGGRERDKLLATAQACRAVGSPSH